MQQLQNTIYTKIEASYSIGKMIIFFKVFVFKHVGLSWMILYLKQAEFECEKKCSEWVEGGGDL